MIINMASVRQALIEDLVFLARAMRWGVKIWLLAAFGLFAGYLIATIVNFLDGNILGFRGHIT